MRKKIVVGDCFKFKDTGRIYPVIGFGAASGHPAIDLGGGDNDYLCMGLVDALPTLHLPISEPWFSRILSGKKTEEYRLKKGFYGQRLCENWDSWIFSENNDLKFKPLKVIHLTNGYGHHRPQLWAHIKEITISRGKPEWGAPDHDVFIIRLGDVFHTKNLKEK